ncbi:MAG TPA: FHA domain-containing protein [Pyrinomonadaceae bacterium]|nr:FHA domain-containing protein [Pyrinomonadaceae bacterium]
MINEKTIESPIERLVVDMIPRLVALDGPLSGRTFYLDGPVLSIGRLVSNDICLDDPFVSREHCVIRTELEHYMIKDLNSVNGTYVNDERIDVDSLEDGSLIEIGASLFLFRLQNPEEPGSEISDLRSIALSQDLVVAENGRSPLDEIRWR